MSQKMSQKTSLKIKKLPPPPNTDGSLIEVEFLILHYTACSLADTLKLFQNEKKKASSHFIIDRNGDILNLIPCLKKGEAVKAFHCGASRFIDSQKKKWEDFNCFSIGIELVNLNGCLFDYTKKQYESLVLLTRVLKKEHPKLRSPERVLGHEHIAGFRGKIDPGLKFNWAFYFKNSYPELKTHPRRKGVLSEELRERFEELSKRLDDKEKDWAKLNLLLERQHRLYVNTH